jgi:putative protease
VLNDLRRQAVEQLLAMRRENAMHKIVQPDALSQLQAQVKAEASNVQTCETAFSILVRTTEQLDCVLELAKANSFKPAMVYLEFKDQREYGSVVSKARSASVTIGISTLRIIKPGESKHLAIIKDAQPDAVLVRNLAALAWCKKNMPGVKLITDFSLNVANELTASVLRDWGVQLMVPSYDLKIKDIDDLIKRTSPAWYEVIVHDRLPMFHTEHCVFADMLGIESNRSGCGKACKNQMHITDCKGVKHLAMSDAGCRNTIYSGQVQSAAMHIGKLKTLGVAQLRINLLEENASAAAALIEYYQQLLAGTVDSAEAYSRISEICGVAHVSAGTLEFKA